MENGFIWKDRRVKLLFLMVLVGFCMVCLIFTAIDQMIRQLNTQEYPKSTLTKEAVAFPETSISVSEMLPVKITCPSLPYTLNLPINYTGKDEKIVGSYGDIDIVICESSLSMDKMIRQELPGTLVASVAGYERDVEIKVQDMGYFYEYPAEYVAMQITTQISIRKLVTYACVYRLSLSDETSLYIYVSAETDGIMFGEKDFLDRVAYSVRPYVKNITDLEVNEVEKVDAEGENVKEGKEEKKEENVLNNGDEGFLRIYHEKEVSFTVKEGVFLYEWANAQVQPSELVVYGPDNRVLPLLEEYSYPGHYVFEIGASDSGTYNVVGLTKEQITGVMMSIYEKESYLDMYVTFGFE